MTVKEIMTPQEVAEYLQLTPDTVYRYIREGKLVASRLGRYYRISRQNVDLLLYVTSIAGETSLRRFSRDEMAEWLEEDAIDADTAAAGQTLLGKLGRS